MKVIIAGSRHISEGFLLEEAIQESGFKITSVISGHAQGIDLLGEAWAVMYQLPCQVFPANWDKYGNAAGPKRNIMMVEIADALIAIWDGSSRGTKNVIDLAHKASLQVYVKELR